jgi:WD40 repeat protein
MAHSDFESLIRAILIFTLVPFTQVATAQSIPSNSQANGVPRAFPTVDFVLRDSPHKEPKSGVQLSPGGQLTIATGVGTPTVINALALSKDAKVIAAGKDFGRVVLWDMAERKFLRALDTNQGIVSAVSLSPDGKVVATGGDRDNGSVKIWEVSSGRLLWTFKQSRGAIQKLFFNSEGDWLVIEDNAAAVYVVSMADQKPVVELSGIHAVAISQEGQALMTADGKEFAIWSPPAWTKTQSIPMSKSFSLLLGVNVAADKFAVYESRSVRIAPLSTGQVTLDRADLVPKNFTWRPTFGEFDSDGAVLYLSLNDRLLVLDANKGEVCSGPVMYSGAAALSRNGQWFVGAKDDSILSKERTDGIWVWNTTRLLSNCGLASSAKSQPG